MAFRYRFFIAIKRGDLNLTEKSPRMSCVYDCLCFFLLGQLFQHDLTSLKIDHGTHQWVLVI